MRGITGRIHSTESFGTVDGPGVRFVVFMQGCPMRCLYCHNPDTQDVSGGKLTTPEEILKKYDSCSEFFKKGGITVSGGEPLLQIDFVTELFRMCRERGIHTALDTSGVTFRRSSADILAKFDTLIKYTDLVLLDIKHIDNDGHKKLTSYSNENILDFAKWLDEKKIPVWIRHVTVPGITYDDELLYRLGRFVGSLSNVHAIEVLKYHDMGKAKYARLGMEYPLGDTPPLTKEQAGHAREVIMRGVNDEKNKNTL